LVVGGAQVEGLLAAGAEVGVELAGAGQPGHGEVAREAGGVDAGAGHHHAAVGLHRHGGGLIVAAAEVDRLPAAGAGGGVAPAGAGQRGQGEVEARAGGGVVGEAGHHHAAVGLHRHGGGEIGGGAEVDGHLAADAEGGVEVAVGVVPRHREVNV